MDARLAFPSGSDWLVDVARLWSEAASDFRVAYCWPPEVMHTFGVPACFGLQVCLGFAEGFVPPSPKSPLFGEGRNGAGECGCAFRLLGYARHAPPRPGISFLAGRGSVAHSGPLRTLRTLHEQGPSEWPWSVVAVSRYPGKRRTRCLGATAVFGAHCTARQGNCDSASQTPIMPSR